MDWWIDNYFIKVAVALTVIFTSKVIRSLWVGICRQVLIALGFATIKIVEKRLRQSEADYRAVLDLRSDSSKMARHVMGSVMPIFLCTLIILTALLYSFAVKVELPQWLSYALVGIASSNLRWFFEATSAYGLVQKAADFPAYEARYLAQQKELKALRKKLSANGLTS